MQGAEKQHVPIGRQLFDVGPELSPQVRIENGIVFKDEHAGHSQPAGETYDPQVAAQAPVSAGRVEPVRRDVQTVSVQRREPAD